MIINNLSPIIDIILFFPTLILSILFHEFGHYLAGTLCGFKPKFIIGRKNFSSGGGKFYLGIEIGEAETNGEYIFIGMTGIIMGFIPIFLLVKNIILILLILWIYVRLCNRDIMGIMTRLK